MPLRITSSGHVLQFLLELPFIEGSEEKTWEERRGRLQFLLELPFIEGELMVTQ